MTLAAAARAQPAPDPAYAPLQKAYDAVRARGYDAAIAAFNQAIVAAPQRASIRKDLAYTLLKVGETEAARDQFKEAMQLDPADEHVALEYAFLCYETKQEIAARRVFDRIRKNGNATAEQAFQNIDRPLAEGIERWRKAVEVSPENFSAHQELARLAEQRDDLELAAQHYGAAFHLKPEERSLLLDLGRVWKELNRTEAAMSALLAASRGAQPRVAERARELLPSRYPYVYEFENAIKLDPKNVELRRELAYLLLEMGRNADAEVQFRGIHELAPDDLLSTAQLGFLLLNRRDVISARPLLEQVLKGDNEELADRVRAALNLPQTLHRREQPKRRVSDEAKNMADKSLQAGYLKDALKYLNIAQEMDPLDFAVMLKLGQTYNNMHHDREAIRWFRMAARSPDAATATEASRAYNNLRPEFQRFRFTAWMFPFYSTRWKDAFGYAQVKEEMKLGRLPLRAYISTRIVGDVREKIGPSTAIPFPQYLSESSVIFGVGLATATWRGVTGWVEAGESVKYLPSRTDLGAAIPDYRGGLSYGKGKGHLIGGSRGWFAETNDDGVYVSRFQDDMLLYSQNRLGYTFRASESGFQPQIYWNNNITIDRLGQYWANYVESGPGIKFRPSATPKALTFSVNVLRGAYLVNAGNPRRPIYFDVRAGLWYAFTR